MTDVLAKQREFLARCKQSAQYFIQSCLKIQHPSIGVLPFRLFSYQQRCLSDFRKNRFNIFLKCRQSGISTLSGAYALWFAMFHSNKKILIVSKRDLDATDFLAKNVQFAYDHLPQWMRDIWETPTRNDHELGFSNGSLIRSLTASKETLRSNASSLNIIDESAFISDMDDMWAGGWSTLQHGGNVIVISTPNGVGNWYWSTWTEAVDKINDFNPIRIHWYEMDWALEYQDPIRKVKVRIAPTDGLRECTTKEEIEKYGEYWSPWLEGEYRGLQRKGESQKFRQEVLAEFIGSGGTILSPTTIKRIGRMIEPYAGTQKICTDPVDYIHPITGELEQISFTGAETNEGLWLWDEPVAPVAPIKKGSRIIEPGKPGHNYVMGVDVATGKNNDYSAIEVFDVDSQEQVAEYMARISVNDFAKVVDYIGRWYNNALTCVDRTGGLGSSLIEDLEALNYPHLWRKIKSTPTGIQNSPYGFAITESTKPILNKALAQHISEEDGEGFTIKSSRFWKQTQIYIRKRNSKGQDTGKIGAQDGKGNHDDLVIGVGLAFIALSDLTDTDPKALLPTRSANTGAPTLITDRAAHQVSLITRNDPGILMPYTPLTGIPKEVSIEQEIGTFTGQIAHSMKSKEQFRSSTPAVVHRRRLLP